MSFDQKVNDINKLLKLRLRLNYWGSQALNIIIYSWVKVGLSTQSRNLTNPTNQSEPKPPTAQINHSDGWCQVATHRTRHLRVDWRVSSPKLEPSDLIIKLKTFGDIRRFFNENLQKPMIVGVLQRRITWKFEIPPDLTRSNEISSRSNLDPTRFSEISTNLTKYQPDLNRSGQITEPVTKLETNQYIPKLNETRIGRSD